ncbi:OB-fold domain-containing protein [Nocardioides endophyticus]|uniref:OB-fold domain-containing protein n=1 Tax=Nocardioides endophyticus TaxID=1353775 RepID=A0ABP8YGI0_9ACTN
MTVEAPVEHVMPRRDADSEPFWAAVERHSLEVPQCRDCKQLRWFPSRLCPGCWSDAADWKPLDGSGTVYSWSTVRRAPSASFRDEVPYIIGLVDLAPNVRMFTRILCDRPEQVEVGAAVKVEFQNREGGLVLPCFRVVGTEVAA